MTEYWYSIFDAATISNDRDNLVSPLEPAIIREYFGDSVSKIFVQWFINKRKML